MKRLFCLVLVMLLLVGCTPQEPTQQTTQPTQPGVSFLPTEKIEGSNLFVKKVENLPEDFILGMDASCVPALEAGGEADPDDLLQFVLIDPHFAQIQMAVIPAADHGDDHQHSSHALGDHRGPCHAGHAHFEHHHEQQIQHLFAFVQAITY